MLPVVPELGPEGFTYTASLAPNLDRTAPAVLPDGDSWCRLDCPPGVAGRIHVRPRYADLYLGLTAAAGTIEYTDLRFGFAATVDGAAAASDQWPPAGRTYLRSDQLWIVTARLRFPMLSVLGLTVWAENAGARFAAEWQFQAPRTVQPYASWTWTGQTWAAPIPYPDDGESYSWDESAGGWVAE